MSEVPSPPPEEGVPAAPPSASVAAPAGAAYPVDVEADLLPEYSRFMPLVKWFLLIPHYVVIFFLAIGAMFVSFIAFFATLFTGTYPQGMWNYMVGFERWVLRVAGYSLLITDKYPPFTLEPTADDTIRLRSEYPERVARWRPLFAWLLVIPYLIVASLIGVVGAICSFLAFFTIIFTKKIPDGLFDVIRISLNWQYRATFYGYWLSTEYPPFEWDD